MSQNLPEYSLCFISENISWRVKSQFYSSTSYWSVNMRRTSLRVSITVGFRSFCHDKGTIFHLLPNYDISQVVHMLLN